MFYHLVFAALCSSALAQQSAEALADDSVINPRFFLFNTSNLSVSLNSVYAGLLAILGGLALLAGLAYLLFLLSGDGGDTGYSSSGYSDTGYTSYASGRAAKAYVVFPIAPLTRSPGSHFSLYASLVLTSDEGLCDPLLTKTLSPRVPAV